jgi:cell wall-associated NlpC family hydrolase
VLLGILAALLAAASASARPPISEKRAEAERVYAQVQELNESLGAANERLNLANLQLAQVKHDLAVNRYELGVAKLNLKRSRQTIAHRLVTLYTTPQTSTLEVILGAASLDEIMVRVDTVDRVSALDSEVLKEVTTFKLAIRRHGIELAHDRNEAKRLVAERAAQANSLASQKAERERLLASINDQIASLEAAARARERQLAAAARAQIAASQTSSVASIATPNVAFSWPPVGSSRYSGAASVALNYLGTPYVWAGASPGGFDCSGLVVYAFSQVGVSLPHSSYALWNVGVPVSSDQLQAGDLVFFHGLGHVGIYIGGGNFVHAPHTGDVVKVSSMYGSYAGSLDGARRVL